MIISSECLHWKHPTSIIVYTRRTISVEVSMNHLKSLRMRNLKQLLFLLVIIINIVELIYCIRSSCIINIREFLCMEPQPNTTLFSIDCSFHCFPSSPRLVGQGFSFRLAHACKRLQTEAKHLVTSICDLIFGNILYTIK